MITFEPEYKAKLWEIQNQYLTKRAVLVPHNEKVFDIDLNKRTVQVPEYLSVQQDHESETIYFKFNRFYDTVDLTNMVCVIQYKNAGGEEYFYPVPFYDITTYGDEPGHKVLIPWCIQGPATAYAGSIEFSVIFFRLDANSNLTYMLNTIPAKGKILQGQNWDFKETTKNQITFDDQFMLKVQKILDAENGLKVYWLDV